MKFRGFSSFLFKARAVSCSIRRKLNSSAQYTCEVYAALCGERHASAVVLRRSKKIVFSPSKKKILSSLARFPLFPLPLPTLRSVSSLSYSQIHVQIEDLPVSQRQELAVLVGSHSRLPREAHPLPWRRGRRQCGWEVGVYCYFKKVNGRFKLANGYYWTQHALRSRMG